MFAALFKFILNLFFWLVGIIGSVIIYPIQVILVTLVPGIGSFLSLTMEFLGEQIFPAVSFAKEIVLDITCLPRDLYIILVGFLFARWAIAPTIRIYKFCTNVWKFTKGVPTS